MTYTEPHNAVCPDCDALLVIAQVDAAGTVTLDATPDQAGAYRAHHTGERWVAKTVGEYPDPEAFFGMRRSEHHCRPADKQLQIDSTEPARAGVSLQTTEEPMCSPAASRSSTPPEPS